MSANSSEQEEWFDVHAEELAAKITENERLHSPGALNVKLRSISWSQSASDP